MTKIKKYNIFILLTTISKSMIEIFIPIILFKKGLSFKEIIIFFLIKYIFLLVFTNIINILKLKNKPIIYISSFISIITYILLYYYKPSFIYLISIAILYALYLCTYWLYRHNIALNIIEDKMITDRSSVFMILTLLGIIPSSLLGGYLINNFNLIYLIIVISIITFISLFFIVDIKDTIIKKNKITIPVNNKIFISLEQFKFIILTLFPLFTFNTILNSYTYIGLLNTVTAIASIIYIFFLAKKMDKNKKDYLNIMCILLGISWILKINILNINWFLIITVFEGVFRFGLETIIMRNIYSYGREYDSLVYNTYIENIRNISRIIISLFILIFNIQITNLIIIGIISLFISSFIKIDDGIGGYKKN